MAWIFRSIQCDDGEALKLPVSGYDAFRHFTLMDAKARQEILKAVNVPFDAKGAQRIKPKHQREIALLIKEAFSEGKVSNEEALPIYRVLNQENLVAWEDEFAIFLDDYGRDQNAKALLTSLETLFQKYRIGPRERARPRALDPNDLEVVGYTFLSRPDVKELTVEF